MSLKPDIIGPVPQETARVAKASCPKGSTFIQMRDELGVLFQDEMFANLFPKDGQPGLAPWRLALVTRMQFTRSGYPTVRRLPQCAHASIGSMPFTWSWKTRL